MLRGEGREGVTGYISARGRRLCVAGNQHNRTCAMGEEVQLATNHPLTTLHTVHTVHGVQKLYTMIKGLIQFITIVLPL
jgi:hypothetical protein